MSRTIRLQTVHGEHRLLAFAAAGKYMRCSVRPLYIINEQNLTLYLTVSRHIPANQHTLPPDLPTSYLNSRTASILDSFSDLSCNRNANNTGYINRIAIYNY